MAQMTSPTDAGSAAGGYFLVTGTVWAIFALTIFRFDIH